MMNNVPPRSHGLLNKSLGARCEIPPYKLLDGEALKSPKPHRLLALLSCPPELDGTTLLLRRLPHCYTEKAS